jgi:glycosyltransferase involved in cell wall biosynthesis
VDDAALIHTTSGRETASVHETNGRARVAEIPNAIDVHPGQVTAEERRAVRSRLGLAAGERVVLFLGRLHPIKRLDLLAAAFAQIARDYPDVRLVAAGGGDDEVRACAERQLGDTRSRVVWTGAVEGRERDALLTETTTLVLCSNSENFGMSVAEALAFGVPPVVTQTCPWQAVEEARAGFWVPQTADDIARGIRAVLDNPAEARAMGARGAQLAAERFHPSAIGAAWAAEYAALLRR